MLRLTRLFDVPTRELPPEQARIIVLESAGRKLGLLVDDVLTQHQVVIKPLRVGMGESDLLAGAAILSDGRVALILNVDRLSGVLGAKRRSAGDSKDAAA
jgi:two-component system chemotaxis sensor kinase CheA